MLNHSDGEVQEQHARVGKLLMVHFIHRVHFRGVYSGGVVPDHQGIIPS